MTQLTWDLIETKTPHIKLICDTCTIKDPKKLHKIRINGQTQSVCPHCYHEIKQFRKFKEEKHANVLVTSR